MKIITWNINGFRAITGQNPSRRFDKISSDNKLFAFIDRVDPDIICMQETKATPDQIDDRLRCPAGYYPFFNSCTSKKGYSGVAIYTKQQPKAVNYSLGIEKFDSEGRLIEASYDGFTLLNIYFPKGYTDNDRLAFKLGFYDAVYSHIEKLEKKTGNIIVSGDYNTAHKEIDLARPKENINTSGFLPVEREKLDWMTENGFIDTFRRFNSEPNHYTWWSQRGRARENNIGWRIDYHFVSSGLAGSLKSAYHLPDVQGSDHCPVVVELK